MKFASFVSPFLSFLAGGLLLFLSASRASLVDAIEVGQSLPSDLSLHFGFPPEEISLNDRFKGKNVLLIGLPGAFTPT
ncbi:hypothetical protein IV203_021820 [Nitzschia inconspicua]|uniref:Redoxin domain-containing protein n=1 Tax=Nitzschia inconspicua TaxID=303405 RepID=A0A9K3PDN2_9STRA|nr:hypothetical protein IV203_021820 [Nitzschia inconspicua]